MTLVSLAREAGVLPVEPVSPEAALDAELEEALVAGLAENVPESSEEPAPLPAAESSEVDEAPLDTESDAAVVAPPSPIAPEVGAGFENMVATSDAPIAALAFATDFETENALREGLSECEVPARHEEPQVWSGGLRTAISTLADGYASRLILVDIDGIPYPAGTLHELAAFCDVGTVVIAIGSNATANAVRDILIAGVSDYLAKPVTAAAVREAVVRVMASAAEVPQGGCVAGFIGTGGSGTTTLATAMALHAAELGRYVSILDLNRTVSTMALMLDVEPPPGLEQLLETADGPSPDPGLVDDVRVERSDRVAVYAYRSSPASPPVARKPAVNWLLTQLRQRSQYVFVDGIDDPRSCFSLLADVDVRVLVFEPTMTGADRAARVVDLLGRTLPLVLVQNHTRGFRRGAAARALRAAGMETATDVVFPFESALPGIADRGWPESRCPRSLRKPLAAFTDRLASAALAGRLAAAELARGP